MGQSDNTWGEEDENGLNEMATEHYCLLVPMVYENTSEW